jgi:hypothetical protein
MGGEYNDMYREIGCEDELNGNWAGSHLMEGFHVKSIEP